MKKTYLKDITVGKKIETTFMIKKIIAREGDKIVAYIGDNSGDVKAYIKDEGKAFKVGDVIVVVGKLENPFSPTKATKVSTFELEDYVRALKRPIDDIMKEIESISEEEFKDKEVRALNDYFFKNDEFLKKFKQCIGGVSQHHNYVGGLAEHTLNVMYLAKTFSYRYNVRYKEIAILASKLHDIGKIEELFYEGPFTYTLKGEMEGHIVLGVTMVEKAFAESSEIYSEDFKERIKACIIQHHGKLEYGSPRTPKTEEAYVVHYADYVDATFNKIENIRDEVSKGEWTPFDKRIEGKLFV